MNARKLLPHAVTLVLAALLVLTQQVWSSPLTGRLESRTAQIASSKTTVNYQGYLTDSGGSPVNDTLDMVFRLYNVESGGTALWTESQLGVLVTDGLFSVLLGSANALPQTLFHENDDLWLGITVGGDEEMTPREKIASVPYAITGGVPPGVIVMWSGSLATIPEGWVLCDGTDGTPDLRNQFVVGAGNSYAVGEAGGAISVTLSIDEMPAHSHAATVDEAGNHQHSYQQYYRTGSCCTHSNYLPISGDGYRDQGTSFSGVHTHTVTIDGTGGGQPHENRPPYYSLAFICKQ